MLSKQQIDFILKIFFLLFAFIYIIKQESETVRYVDYSDESEKTYSGFVVDLKSNSGLELVDFFFIDTSYNYSIPVSAANFSFNQSTFELSFHHICNNFGNLSPIFLPKTSLIKILQKKNICHQSSDDLPVPPVHS